MECAVFVDVTKDGVGKALFSLKKIDVRKKIFDFLPANIYSYEELKKTPAFDQDLYIQIGNNKYLGPSGQFDDYINHSCDPNTAVVLNGNWPFLISIKEIKKGDELTYDYSTTIADEWYTMNCSCHNLNCRKTIGSFERLPPEFKKKYIALGIIPEYLLKKEYSIA